MSSDEQTHLSSGGHLDESTVQAGHSTLPGQGDGGHAELLKRGATVDRYVILERIGAGGMGVVYAAYDPNLDRRVALKLLLSDARESAKASTGHSRTLREAQAMARLSHPNVVTVHDVGAADGVVYIAMELVEGQTLSAWLDRQPRRWSEVVEVFEAAGAGLVAAHASGLVHRDFKLDNVMVGDDGRIRVMDFGLARNADAFAPSADTSLWSSDSGDVDRLTRTGALVGTPAYMAPEVFKGSGGDASSDQFAYCVALFRCLYGLRPFQGSNMTELYQSTSGGQLVTTPIAKVPRWLATIVRRGLSADPDRRFGSMEALLKAVARGRRLRSRLWAATGVVAVAAAASAASVMASSRECSGGDARVAAVWDAQRQTALRDAFVASGAGQAADASSRVIDALQRHTTQWSEGYRAACDANRRGEQSDDLLDRRMACLSTNLAEVEALVEVFGRADRSTVAKAVVAVSGLSSTDVCADIEGLVADVASPTDPEVRPRVEALRAELAAAGGLSKAGQYQEALARTAEIAERAENVPFRPLRAEIEFALADLQMLVGQPSKALARLQAACFEAEASRHDAIAAQAWTQRVFVEGVALAQYQAGHDAAQRAEAAVIRAGESLRMQSALAQQRAALASEEGNHTEALAGYRRALDLAERDRGPESLAAAEALGAVGSAQFKLGHPSDALVSYQRAHAILVAILGEQHPRCARLLENIGTMNLMLGNLEQGRDTLEQALAVLEATLGSEHPKVGETLFNLGWAAQKMKDPGAALEFFARARTLELPRLGDGHPLIGQYEASIAVVLGDMDRWADAREHLQAALAVFVATQGPRHNFVARVHHDLALASNHLADTAAAETHFKTALSIREEVLAADHPELGDTLQEYIELLVALRRFDDAQEHVEPLLVARRAHAADDAGDVVWALLLAGDVARGRGDEQLARRQFKAAAQLAQGVDAALRQTALERLEESALSDVPSP